MPRIIELQHLSLSLSLSPGPAADKFELEQSYDYEEKHSTFTYILACCLLNEVCRKPREPSRLDFRRCCTKADKLLRSTVILHNASRVWFGASDPVSDSKNRRTAISSSKRVAGTSKACNRNGKNGDLSPLLFLQDRACESRPRGCGRAAARDSR